MYYNIHYKLIQYWCESKFRIELVQKSWLHQKFTDLYQNDTTVNLTTWLKERGKKEEEEEEEYPYGSFRLDIDYRNF